MAERIRLDVNGRVHDLQVEPGTPLLYVLRNDLGLNGGEVRLRARAVRRVHRRRRRRSVRRARARSSRSRAGGSPRWRARPARRPPPAAAGVPRGAGGPVRLLHAGIIGGARRCSTATPDPTDVEIRQALARHLCRCGAHLRILKAVRRAAGAGAMSDAASEPQAPPPARHVDADRRRRHRHPVHRQGRARPGDQSGDRAHRRRRSSTSRSSASAWRRRTPRAARRGVSTAGSMSIEESGAAMRQAAAEARAHLLGSPPAS